MSFSDKSAQQYTIQVTEVFLMPSTRKQKARAMRCRLSDVMPDLENMDVMLGSYSRNEVERHQGDGVIDVDLEANGPQNNVIPISEDFMSLLNIISSEILYIRNTLGKQ